MKRGFTILELLVVVAIIAVLLSATAIVMSSSRAKSRDATRMAELRQIQNALNLYFTANNAFPVFATETTITGDDAFSLALENAGTIDEVPTDPNHPATPYTYQSNAEGTTYILSFCLETDTIAGFSQGCGNTLTP